jgi:hypothetical protein
LHAVSSSIAQINALLHPSVLQVSVWHGKAAHNPRCSLMLAPNHASDQLACDPQRKGYGYLKLRQNMSKPNCLSEHPRQTRPMIYGTSKII